MLYLLEVCFRNLTWALYHSCAKNLTLSIVLLLFLLLFAIWTFQLVQLTWSTIMMSRRRRRSLVIGPCISFKTNIFIMWQAEGARTYSAVGPTSWLLLVRFPNPLYQVSYCALGRNLRKLLAIHWAQTYVSSKEHHGRKRPEIFSANMTWKSLLLKVTLPSIQE